MIRHIVLWKFLDKAEGAEKVANLRKARMMLMGLKEKIPEIKSFEVGIVLPTTDQSYDLALDSTFESIKALEAYQRHPAHLQVVHFLRKVQVSKAVADFEI
jgi:hypothetical protein